jgi:dihydropyrimidine dehydrogenase (NAD+) subunit PreA
MRKGFGTINDFIGKSVETITHWEDLDINYHHVAKINQDKCIHCGLCYIACEDTSHQSINLTYGKPYNTYTIKEEECVGCNLCQLICPLIIALHGSTKKRNRIFKLERVSTKRFAFE